MEKEKSHLLVMCKGEGYSDEKIVIITPEYPFNTIAKWEKEGYKLMIDTLVSDVDVRSGKA